MENKVHLPDDAEDRAQGFTTAQVLHNDPLWDLVRYGDSDAFETVFKSYYPALLNYGLKFNKDEEEIKDCIQTLFLNIWERRSFLSSSNSIRNYLLASLRRLILKRMKIHVPLVELDIENLGFHVELSTEGRMIQDEELAQNVDLIQKAIINLPARQREALYLKFYSNQSFAEVAAVMNISTRAVYKLIYKALDTLGAALNPQLHATFRVNLNLLLVPGLCLIERVISV